MPYTRNANRPTPQQLARFLVVVLLFAALSCFIIGRSNLRLANRAKPTIHILTAAELIARGPGDNAYVRIERATPLVRWYAAYRDRSGNENWRTYIYVPLVPANASSAGQAAPPRIFLRTRSVWSKADLPKLEEAGAFEGIAYKGVDSLAQSAQNLLKSRFPNTDLANCYVIKHNLRPPSKPAAILTLALGAFLTVLALLVLGLRVRTFGPISRG